MARTYYNAGSAGRNYSQLVIEKCSSTHLNVTLINSNGVRNSMELNQDQIRDLLVQLESVKKTEAMIEGNI